MKELGGNARGKWSHLEPVRMKPMRAPREIDLGIVLPGTSATAARAHGGMLKRVDAASWCSCASLRSVARHNASRPGVHSLSDDDDNSRRNDGARDRHRRKRSPDDDDGKHRRSRRPRDDNDDSAARHHHHRSERRKDRDGSPRHSRRSRHARHDHRSRSRSPKRRRPSTSASPPRKRSAKPLPSQEAAYRGSGDGSGEAAGEPVVEKQKPNFKQTGLLAREANTVAGTDIVLKYNEPPDARKPPARDDWRLFVFKGQDCLQTVELGSRSCWLVGREAAVADLLVEHPSTSKQHAVLQFRHTTRVNEYGDKDARVRPYLIDLESSNGTILNGKQIEATRFVEVMDKDVVKFGLSEREYVLMLAKA
ncbi:putative fha domain-containing protein snip1 protein [Lasiodiplodia theobromae]|nr:putative fha domain-containing protein snip1 protein [Lasiodiplodia theobromae]